MDSTEEPKEDSIINNENTDETNNIEIVDATKGSVVKELPVENVKLEKTSSDGMYWTI